jgi:hypothetical protein
MQKARSHVYWLGLGVAMTAFLCVADIVHRGVAGLVIFCLLVAAVSYRAGGWIRSRMARRAHRDA